MSVLPPTGTQPIVPYERSLPLRLTNDGEQDERELGKSRVELQDICRQFILIADMQALTDNADKPEKVRGNVLEVMLDYFAVRGVNPHSTERRLSGYSQQIFRVMRLIQARATDGYPWTTIITRHEPLLAVRGWLVHSEAAR